MIHIRMGCLSRIPPGGGTTKNERFHQHMTFIGARLECSLHTYALLISVIIFQYNSHSKINKKVVLRPIEAKQSSHELGVRQNPVGIIPTVNKCSTECEQWEIDLPQRD